MFQDNLKDTFFSAKVCFFGCFELDIRIFHIHVIAVLMYRISYIIGIGFAKDTNFSSSVEEYPPETIDFVFRIKFSYFW